MNMLPILTSSISISPYFFPLYFLKGWQSSNVTLSITPLLSVKVASIQAPQDPSAFDHPRPLVIC